MTSEEITASEPVVNPSNQEMLEVLLKHQGLEPNTLILNLFNSMNQKSETESSEDKGPYFETFMKFKPPTFSSSTDPIVAENWIKAMECIFRVIRKKTSEEDKVDLVTYLLEDESMHWWETVQDRLGTDRSIEWSEF
jgi:hypothetical protein